MGETIEPLPTADELVTEFYEVDIAQATSRIKYILETYAAGKQLFPRDLLQDLDRQISENKEHVYIKNFDGEAIKYSLKVPDWFSDTCESYRIMYSSIEQLTNFDPDTLPDQMIEQRPVSICYVDFDKHPTSDLDQVKRTFTHYNQEWMKSETCTSLRKQFAASTVYINKMVCFALGSPSWMDNQRIEARCYTQHAAVQTIAEVLAAKNGTSISCFAQDPEYSDVDKEFLRSIGITPVEDPKGFLEVDDRTLVISISPNVPVKQIVADVQWPAAMMWNTVTSEEIEEKKEWKKEIFDDDESERVTWVSPFSTDPDSLRVRSMVEHYQPYELPDSNDHFGDLTIYLKN
ncbi:hypothetical protein B7463_g11992, partial [Scytalidium lignicola]